MNNKKLLQVFTVVMLTLSFTGGLAVFDDINFSQASKSELALSGEVGVGAQVVDDWDQDGMSDRCEERWGFDPSNPADALSDPDQDGLNNRGECSWGTNPFDWDTDDGGVGDGDEVYRDFTNPLDGGDDKLPSDKAKEEVPTKKEVPDYIEKDKDTDGDGLIDSLEFKIGTDIYNPDTDFDGLNDKLEYETYKTDPLNWDTDGGGMGDGSEVLNSLDPKNSSDDKPLSIEVNYRDYAFKEGFLGNIYVKSPQGKDLSLEVKLEGDVESIVLGWIKPISRGAFFPEDGVFFEKRDNNLWVGDLKSPEIIGVYQGVIIVRYKDGSKLKYFFHLDDLPEGVVYRKKKGDDFCLCDMIKALFCCNDIVSETIEGARIDVFRESEDGWKKWSAERYNQKNPSFSNERGNYVFFAPKGRYYFEISKEGFYKYKSEVLDFEQADLINRHIELQEKRTCCGWICILIILLILFLIFAIIGWYINKQRREKQKRKNEHKRKIRK